MSVDPFSPEAADKFLSGGGIAAKWPKVGHVFEGTVTGWSMSQQTDYDTAEPLFWKGKKKVAEAELSATDKRSPVMQLVINVQGEPTGETWEGLANERVELPDDDGARTMYVKGGLQAAISLAMKNAGNAKLEEGAHIRVERVANGPKTNPKFAAPHRYKAVWTRAEKNPDAANALLSGEGEESPFEEGEESPF